MVRGGGSVESRVSKGKGGGEEALDYGVYVMYGG